MLWIGSLFSGAGLCDLGFHKAGYGHRFFCEADPYCRSVLARHWPGVPAYDDVRTLSGDALPPVDVLAGGFPCQDVSGAGRRAGITTTTRSGLWYEFRRLISEIRPRYAVVENVKGLLSKGMEVVLQDLSELGYDAEWQSLSAAAFGAPHLRDRVFIVAYPLCGRAPGTRRIFATHAGDMGADLQFGRVSDWLGIRFSRSSRKAIRQAYDGPVLWRVDDGRTPRLDDAKGAKPCRPPVPYLDNDTYNRWRPMLKALGNGITPAQAHYVAMCILRAEGLI